MRLEDIKKEFPEFIGKTNWISIGNGWYPIIYDLSAKVTNYCKENNLEIPNAMIIKEKFGQLVVDLNKHDDKNIDNFIYEAKKQAQSVEE